MTEPPDTWPGSIRSRALAWSLVGVDAMGIAAILVHSFRTGGWSLLWADFASSAPLLVPFVALGALVALRRPANPLGWLLTAGGLTWVISSVTAILATDLLSQDPEDVTGRAVATFNDQIWPLGLLLCIGLPLLLFPTGRQRSGRWGGAVARLMVAACILALVASPLSTNPVVNPVDGGASLVSPWAFRPLAPLMGALAGVSVLTLMTTILAAVVSVIAGFRHASGTQRQQFRWVFAGGAMAGLGILAFFIGAPLGLPPRGVSAVGALGLACFPVSFAVAILRYHLYDLDRIVSRTVSYAVVTGLLVATYAGLATGVSRLIPDNSKSLAVAAATLAVAALLQPVRRRVQAVVDRRFNRSRYDSARTVEAFSQRLRVQVDLAALEADLLSVVRDSMQPASAALWLRRTSGAAS